MSTNKKPIKRGSLKSKCRLKKLQLGGETPFGNQNEFLNLKTPNTNLQTPTYNFGDYSKGKYTNGNTSYNFNDVSTWGDPGTVNLQTDLSTSTTTSNLGSGSMLSFAGSILGDYLDSVDEKNMKPINKLMNDAASNLRYVDIGKIGAESTSFNRGENMENALELDTNIRKQIKVNQGATRVANMTQPNNYAPVAKLGGTIARGGLNIYKGPTHEQVSEDGNTGILVDAQGNPVKMSFANAVAEVEGGGKGKKGEVSWFNKKSGETYVFPVSGAGTAPQAQKIINNYKLNKPNTTYDKDILLTEAVDAQLENLKQATEMSKETGTELKDTLQFAKKGGSLSRYKAGEMLKDGTANGKKLTAKQKRYFAMKAYGKYEEGGSFSQAFANARQSGLKTFDWKGKSYGTQTADEAIKENKPQWIYEDKPNYMGAVERPYSPERYAALNTKPTTVSQPVSNQVSTPIEEEIPIKEQPKAQPKSVEVKQARNPIVNPLVAMTDPNNLFDRIGRNPNQPKPQPTKKEVTYNKPKTQEAKAQKESNYTIPGSLDFYREMKETQKSLPSDVKERVGINKKNEKFNTWGGKYFVYSKENGNLYMFNNKHELTDSTPAGRGATKGDFANDATWEGEYPKPGDQFKPNAKATTPAGTAVVSSKNRMGVLDYGSPAYSLDFVSGAYKDLKGLGMHATWPKEKDFRDAIIKNPEIVDKLVSWGCINVPEDKINGTMQPEVGDSLYVTKEPNMPIPYKALGGSLEEPTKNASVYQTNNIPIRLTQQQAYDRYISKNNPNLDFNKFSKMPLDEQKALSYDPSFSISKGKELESMYKDNAIYQYTRDIKGPTNMLATDGSISMPNVSDAYLLSKGLNPNFKFGGDLPKYDGKSTKNQILPPDEEKYLREIGMTDKQINQIRQNKLNKYLSGLTKEQKRDRRREILNTPKDTYEPIGYGTPYGEVTGDTGFEQRPMNTLDIPAGQVIKGSDEVPVKPKGTGTTFKPTKPTLTAFTKPNTSQLKPNLTTQPGLEDSLFYMSTTHGAPENYTPTLSPLGHGLSAIGSVADYFAMNKALKEGKPEDVKLPRTAAERVSYARQRLINERNAAASRATAAATARATGLNAGSAYANTMAARTGVDRVLGQENMKSLEDEANQNALLAQQANMLNAELGAQEALFNTQSGNSYRWQKAMLEAENNPLGNLSKIAASYFADNSAYGRGYDTMHMAYPDAYTYKDPEATFYDKLFRNKSSKSGVKDRSLV
jgi:archaellin